MVALLVFGMIAAAGAALLSFSVRAQGATAAKLDDVGAVARLDSLLAADFAQAVDRPSRDERGTLLPAFTGDGLSFRLVRGGWMNVDAAPRSSLQKVEYRFSANAIERIAYPLVDGAAPLPPTVVLDRVTGLTWRYRIQGAWSERWDGTQGSPLPQAAEMTIQRSDGRSYRQMYLVGSGAPPEPPEIPEPSNAT
ncbi:type II secretion system minor pseudopilin GspJ [Sphingomonas sp. SUN019]|nr:type II secretion system minor pseudopilin GspJ [Sphingomonas sp. SUN019]